jgi:TonB-linked SusC/RagA family outer membrane protein
MQGFTPSALWAQNARVSLNLKDAPITNAFQEIKLQTKMTIVYNVSDVDPNQKVNIEANNETVTTVLDRLLSNTDLTYSMEGNYIVFAKKGATTTALASTDPIAIKGTVVDKEGLPLIGVSINVAGTTVAAATDVDGNFTLSTTRGSTLVISYVGYKNQSIKVNNASFIQVVLEESAILLSDVVVTALGIKKEERSLSYNIQQIPGGEVTKITDANFVNTLNGRIAGATINTSSAGAGGATRVVMRGVKSISGNNNVLYVVDGIPMPNLQSAGSDDVFEGAGQTGDGISHFNPDDIENLSVLSGPSAAALYGSSAANGVILITTKRGDKERLAITVSNSTQFSRPLILPKFQNTYGQSERGSYYSWGEKLATPSTYNPADFFQTGVNVSNSVSLSTGSERNQTYVSAGTVNSTGIVHNNNYDRYNFSVRNTSSFFNNKVTMDLGFIASLVTEQNMTTQGQYFNPLIPVYLFPPGDDFSKVQIYQRYNASRNFQTQFWPYGSDFSMQNPYWITEKDLFVNHKSRYMVNALVKYDIADWINISGRARLDKDNERFEKKFHASTNTLFTRMSENGYYSLNQIANQQIYGDMLVNINKYFLEQTLNLSANVGASFEHIANDQNLYGGGLLSVADLFTFNNIDPSATDRNQSGYRTLKESVFANAQLGYKGLAYLDLSGRVDWPSTLAGADTKSFFYPSVGLSGIITDIFNISNYYLSYAKLRISYSEVGNEPSVFLTIPTYPVAGGYPQTQTRMPNPNLKPEHTKSWEAGLNVMLFDSKLRIDATLYQSSTYNQFFEPTLSSSSGFTSVVVNAGRVDNKGIELLLNYNNNWGDFNWSTFLTYSLNQNKIVELLPGWTNPVTGEIISLSELNMGGTDSYRMVLKEGGSMGDIYVNTLKTDEHGAIYVHPADYVVTADPNNFVYAGNSNPKYNLGWGNTLSWKGISLDFLFTARVGGIVVSNTQAIMDAFGVSQASADARDAGGAIVNGRVIPAEAYYKTVGGGTSGIGAMYVYSATNIRLSELKLSYDLPVTKWCDWLKGATVSLIGRNLFFLYNKAPFDPELTANTGTYYQGVDYFMTPSTRNLGFSVRLKF